MKGFDKLDNLVLDECVEYLKGTHAPNERTNQTTNQSQLFIYIYSYADPNDPYRVTEQTRPLGLVVCRGPQISLICPSDGLEEIANPFAEEEEEEEA